METIPIQLPGANVPRNVPLKGRYILIDKTTVAGTEIHMTTSEGETQSRIAQQGILFDKDFKNITFKSPVPNDIITITYGEGKIIPSSFTATMPPGGLVTVNGSRFLQHNTNDPVVQTGLVVESTLKALDLTAPVGVRALNSTPITIPPVMPQNSESLIVSSMEFSNDPANGAVPVASMVINSSPFINPDVEVIETASGIFYWDVNQGKFYRVTGDDANVFTRPNDILGAGGYPDNADKTIPTYGAPYMMIGFDSTVVSGSFGAIQLLFDNGFQRTCEVYSYLTGQLLPDGVITSAMCGAKQVIKIDTQGAYAVVLPHGSITGTLGNYNSWTRISWTAPIKPFDKNPVSKFLNVATLSDTNEHPIGKITKPKDAKGIAFYMEANTTLSSTLKLLFYGVDANGQQMSVSSAILTYPANKSTSDPVGVIMQPGVDGTATLSAIEYISACLPDTFILSYQDAGWSAGNDDTQIVVSYHWVY